MHERSLTPTSKILQKRLSISLFFANIVLNIVCLTVSLNRRWESLTWVYFPNASMLFNHWVRRTYHCIHCLIWAITIEIELCLWATIAIIAIKLTRWTWTSFSATQMPTIFIPLDTPFVTLIFACYLNWYAFFESNRKCLKWV